MLVVATILAITLLPVGSYLALLIVWLALAVASTVARLGPMHLSRSAFIAAITPSCAPTGVAAWLSV